MTHLCDCCGEYWEAEFFCAVCESRNGSFDWVEVPRIDSSGYARMDDMTVEQWVSLGTVCKNCCTCHIAYQPSHTDTEAP